MKTIVALAFLCLPLALTCHASTVYTYTYAGNAFTSFGGGGVFSAADSITVSFDVSSLLAANLSGASIASPLVTGFSMTDGLNTFSADNTGWMMFLEPGGMTVTGSGPYGNNGVDNVDWYIQDLATDSLGNLTEWQITLFFDGTRNIFDSYHWIDPQGSQSVDEGTSLCGYCGGGSYQIELSDQASVNSTGTWTITSTSTPEPSTWALVIGGLFLTWIPARFLRKSTKLGI